MINLSWLYHVRLDVLIIAAILLPERKYRQAVDVRHLKTYLAGLVALREYLRSCGDNSLTRYAIRWIDREEAALRQVLAMGVQFIGVTGNGR